MNTGSVLAQFTITLSKAVTEPVAVDWFTSDGTAKAGIDYAANKGTAIFAPGETAKAVEILVYGRAVGSEDRSFFVEMLPPTNAILGSSIGECIIHVDTSGSAPVTQIIVPTGPKGDDGDSAYQVWLEAGHTGTEEDFLHWLRPSAEEIAQEVAPLIDVGATTLTAQGTEAFSKPDATTVKAIARRVAYAGPAKIATVLLADGDNLLSPSDLTGDVIDFTANGFVPMVLHAGSMSEPVWDIDGTGNITIKSVSAGDVLYAIQYATVSARRRFAWQKDLIELQSHLKDPAGSTLYPELHIARWRDDHDVRGWGITEQVDMAELNARLFDLSVNGGGTVKWPAGIWMFSTALVLHSNVYHVGAGEGVTIWTQPVGANTDIFKTHGFDQLTGQGPLVNAPVSFGITGVTVNGNYLADYLSASDGGDTTVNNTSGYGGKVFGSKYKIDIEIVNCAQVGFYSEAFDYTGYKFEQDSILRLSGRVFGKEAIVFRGPADINIEHVIIGCPGWLATEAARQSTVVMSELFPGEPVHVMVSDETVVGATRYNGHHEFTFMHLYGNYNGYGYKAINTGRLKGSHLVCENCRGGAYFGTRAWGEVSIIECHNNGRNPSALAGTLEVFPDIDVYSLQSFTVGLTIRRSKMEAANYIGLRSSGKLTRANLNYYSIGTIPANSPVATITSQDSVYDIMLNGVSGDAVSVAGVNNRVEVNGSDVTSGSLVKRVSGTSSQNRNNDIRINAHNVANILNLDGLVTTESIKIVGELNSGQTVVSGTAIDMVSRGVSLDIAARVNGVLATSYDVGRVNLDNTLTTEQSIQVNHNYFQVPDAAQISFNLYDPAPTYGGKLEYLYLQSITATQLTFVYKLSSIGSGGPLVLCWRIQ